MAGKQVDVGTEATRYDAFISYSSRSNTLAASLQHWLERFATPWYGRRRLRIFRDYTSLAAGNLGANLIDALQRSSWLIILASPDAAASTWVDQEVAWWRRHRSADRVIVVLTAGTLRWDAAVGDWHADTDALPAAAYGMFAAEPLWVDLRVATGRRRLDRSDPDLLNSVARIAAPLRGVDKDSIVGEHLTQLRRARRERIGGVMSLATLMVASIVAATVAVLNARDVQAQARVIEARALVAASSANLRGHLDVAQLLAVEAYRRNPDALSTAALFQAVTSSPALQRFLPAGEPVTQVAGSSDGQVIIAGTASGRILQWRGAERPLEIGHLDGPVNSLAVDGDASVVAASSFKRTLIWQSTSTLTYEPSTQVAVSPSGDTLAMLHGGSLSTVDLQTREITTIEATLGESVGTSMVMPSDAELVIFDGEGWWERRGVPGLDLLAEVKEFRLGTKNYGGALSPDGTVFTFASGGEVVPMWRTDEAVREFTDASFVANSAGPIPSAIAISMRGSFVATAANGTIYLSPVSSVGSNPGRFIELTGLSTVNSDALRFLDDGQRLVAASLNNVVVWDRSQPSRIAKGTPVRVPSGTLASLGTGPEVSVSRDGKFAWIMNDLDSAIMLDIESGTQVDINLAQFKFDFCCLHRSITWYGSGHDLLAVDVERGEVAIYDARSLDRPKIRGILGQPPWQILAIFGLAATGDIAYLTARGVEVRDVTDGHLVKEIKVDIPTSAQGLYGGFNADGSIATLLSKDALWLIDIASGTVTQAAGPADKSHIRSQSWAEGPPLGVP